MLLAVLKFFSIVSAAFFGIYASLANFRDNKGKITKSGYIGLTGVICSATIAGFLQVYSDAESSKRSVLLTEQNNIILSDIRRSLNPLNGLEVDFSLEPNWKDPDFRVFYENFKNRRDSNETSFGGAGLPDVQREPLLNDVLYPVGLKLFFFKEPIKADTFDYQNYQSVTGGVGEDLYVEITNPAKNVQYDVKSDSYVSLEQITELGEVLRLYLEARGIKIISTSLDWRSNSKIISLYDLLGCQLLIQLDASGYRPESDFELIEKKRKEVILTELVLKIPNGIVMSFDKDNLKEITVADAYKLYEFNFPEEMDELITSTEYNEFKQIDILSN